MTGVKKLAKSKLTFRFFWFFTALGLAVALGVGLMMYSQYIGYVKKDYRDMLSRVVTYLEKQYPVLYDFDYIMEEGLAQSDEYWELTERAKNIAESFNMAYIYCLVRDGGNWRFVLDSSSTPDNFTGMDPDDYFTIYEPTEDMINAERTGKLYISPKPFSDEFGTFVSVLDPIVKNGTVRGFLCADYDYSFTSRLEGRAKTALALSLAGAVFLSTLLAFIVSFNFAKPIIHAIESLKIAAKGDLTVRIERGKTHNELDELLDALGTLLEKLKTSFNSFNQNAAMVKSAVFDLSASAREITTTANEQSASVAEIVTTMENSKELSEQVASKTIDVADLAAQTREMSLRGAELRDANEDMMMDIRDQNAKIIEEIKNLADMLSRIDESVQLIDTIADQTKLIAFNATLEASSAGEAGARFAVVASEIRRFADNVVESLREIKERIAEIQEASVMLISEANDGTRAIDTGYTGMVEQKEVFANIVGISRNVAARSEEISSLSKQQEFASAQIFTTLKEISTGVKQFVTATASTSATADNLNNMSAELKETLAKYQTSVGYKTEHKNEVKNERKNEIQNELQEGSTI